MTDPSTERASIRHPRRIRGLLEQFFPRGRSRRRSGPLTVMVWSEEGFRAIRVDPGGDSRDTGLAHSSTWPQAETSADPETLGIWLRQELESAGLAADPILLVFPRSGVFQKVLTLPAGGAADAPKFVQYLVQSLPAANGGDCVYDFTSLDSTEQASAVSAGPHSLAESESPAASRVLLSVMKRPTFERASATIAAAGLSLAGASLSTDLIAAAVRARAGEIPEGGDRLIVSSADEGTEVIVQRGTGIVGTQHLEGGSGPLSLPLLRRFLLATNSSRGNVPITEAVVIGAPATTPEVTAVINEALPEATVRSFDLSETAEASGGAGSPAAGDSSQIDTGRSDISLRVLATGGLYAFSNPTRTVVDFHSPQEPSPERPRRTRAMIAAGGLLALVIGGLYLQRESRLEELDGEYQTLLTEQRELKRQIMEGQPDVESERRLHRWFAGQPVWLDDLLHLSDRMPAADRAYVVRLELNTAASDGSDDGGQMRVAGYARDLRDVITINQKLARLSDRYDPLPHAIRRSSLDDRYPYRFDLDVKLRTVAPASTPNRSPEVARRGSPIAGDSPAATTLADNPARGRQSKGAGQ